MKLSSNQYQLRIRNYYIQNPDMIGSPLTPGGLIAPLSFDILSKINLSRAKVLDVGCGYGLLSKVCRHYGALSYTGLDITNTTVLTAHHLNAKEKFLLCDSHSIPFKDSTFDVALCIDSLEHFLSPKNALTEIHRVLRNGGFLLISSPSYFNVAGLFKYLLENLDLYPKNTFAPFLGWRKQELERLFTENKIRKLLRNTKYQVLNFEGGEIFDGLLPFMNLSVSLFRNNIIQCIRGSLETSRNSIFMKYLGLHIFVFAQKC